jgi:hypothetical protein
MTENRKIITVTHLIHHSKLDSRKKGALVGFCVSNQLVVEVILQTRRNFSLKDEYLNGLLNELQRYFAAQGISFHFFVIQCLLRYS